MKLELFKIYVKTITLFILLLILSEIVVRWYPRRIPVIDFNWKVTRQDLQKYTLLENKPYNLTFDGHMHTIHSDGSMDSTQLLDYQIANGYDVIIPTEHNSIQGALEIQKASIAYNKQHNTDILVIPGMEYTCCRIHMNFINIKSDVDLIPTKKFPTNEDLQLVIQKVHDQGGLVIVNHLIWSLNQVAFRNERVLLQHPSKEELKTWGVDGFEVVNQDVFDYPTYIYCKNNSLIPWSGSDVHWPSYPFGWNVIESEKSIAAIISNLKLLKSTIIIHPYPENLYMPSVIEQSPFLSFFDGLNAIFKSFFLLNGGMYSFVDGSCHNTLFELQIVAIISYLFWIFLVTCFYYFISFTFLFRCTIAYMSTAYLFIKKKVIRTPVQEQELEHPLG